MQDCNILVTASALAVLFLPASKLQKGRATDQAPAEEVLFVVAHLGCWCTKGATEVVTRTFLTESSETKSQETMVSKDASTNVPLEGLSMPDYSGMTNAFVPISRHLVTRGRIASAKLSVIKARVCVVVGIGCQSTSSRTMNALHLVVVKMWLMHAVNVALIAGGASRPGGKIVQVEKLVFQTLTLLLTAALLQQGISKINQTMMDHKLLDQ